MKKHFILGALAVASLSFTACSDDNSLDEITNPSENNNEQTELSKSFEPLAKFAFESKLGSVAGSSASSRTIGDVDSEYRPDTKYYLDHIYMLALNPDSRSQPKDEDADDIIGVNTIIHYDKQTSTMNCHTLSNKVYNLYYRLGDDVKQQKEDCSCSGSIYLSPTGRTEDEVKFELSVFLLDDLQNSKDHRIDLNKFAYNKGIVGNLRGTTLRYASYDPTNVAGREGSNDVEEGLTGQYVSLPAVEGFDFLKKDTKLSLVSECEDRYFSGSEFLIAADDKQIYLLQVYPVENALGGYLQVRSYPTPKGQANPEMLALNRLTTIVNASFMITDDKGYTASYYVQGNEGESIKRFKEQHGIDLRTMTCPYATVDGMNSHYYINEYEKKDKSTNISRLVLWAKGHDVVGVDGKTYDNQPRLSNDIFFATHSDSDVINRGFGIEGRSYSVVFEGIQSDTENAQITFFVTVEGVNIMLKAFMPAAGIAMNKNVAHNLIVSVPETKFVQFVKEHMPRSGSRASNEFFELVLPEGSVVVK